MCGISERMNYGHLHAHRDNMEVQPVPFEVQPLFYKPKGERYGEISFDGMKWYTFKILNILPYHWTKKLDYIILYTEAEYIRCDGYYNKEHGYIKLFYNRKLYKLYKEIIKHQKLERLKQTFLKSEEKRKEEIMSMKELKEIRSGRVDLDEAPEAITPTRIETEIKEDPADKVKCLYVNFFWEGKEKEELTLTMKYRPFHIKVLMERMNALKIKNIADYVNKMWKLEKKPFGTLGYPHYLPPVKES